MFAFGVDKLVNTNQSHCKYRKYFKIPDWNDPWNMDSPCLSKFQGSEWSCLLFCFPPIPLQNTKGSRLWPCVHILLALCPVMEGYKPWADLFPGESGMFMSPNTAISPYIMKNMFPRAISLSCSTLTALITSNKMPFS